MAEKLPSPRKVKVVVKATWTGEFPLHMLAAEQAKLPPILRAKGHKLTMTWSGEFGVESSSTGTCPCGWEESASSQVEVRHEYRCHLEQVLQNKGRNR